MPFSLIFFSTVDRTKYFGILRGNKWVNIGRFSNYHVEDDILQEQYETDETNVISNSFKNSKESASVCPCEKLSQENNEKRFILHCFY